MKIGETKRIVINIYEIADREIAYDLEGIGDNSTQLTGVTRNKDGWDINSILGSIIPQMVDKFEMDFEHLTPLEDTRENSWKYELILKYYDPTVAVNGVLGRFGLRLHSEWLQAILCAQSTR